MTNPVFEGVSRGVPTASQAQGKPPLAQFADPQHIRTSGKLTYQDGKVFLGVIDAQMTRSKPDEHGATEPIAMGGHAVGLKDDRHMITVAGSRAGKGRSAILPNMLTYTGSILATDPKGELASLTATRRADKLGQNVRVLDPFGVADVPDQYRASFNPLSILHPTSATVIEDAGLIADALIIPTGGDSHWDESARELITAILLHLVMLDVPIKCTLPEMRKILRDDSELEFALSERAANDVTGDVPEVLRGLAITYLSKPDKERGSVASTARRQTAFLDFPAMKDVLTHHDFDLSDLKSEPTTVYLCLPATRMGTCNRWLRLFINLALSAMETHAAKPRDAVLFCLDEFATLGHMQTIENAAGQIAGFGVKLWPILQDLGQLKTLYKDRWETFVGNAGVLQFFGNTDLTTLKWISEKLGHTTLRVMTKGEVGYKQAASTGATGESWQNDVQPLITVDELSRIFSRHDPLCRQLVLWDGRAPMILQRAYYDKHEMFQ